MITRIEASNYRCFDRLDVDLGELSVIVGANGAGKTTFLDVPVLLSDLLKARNVSSAFLESLPPRGARASTLTEIVHRGRGEEFTFAVEGKLPDKVVHDLLERASKPVRDDEERWPRFVRYELRLRVFNRRALQVRNEYLFTFAEHDAPPRSDPEGGARLHGEHRPCRHWHFACRRESGSDVELRPETHPKANRRVILDVDILALPSVRFEDREDYPAARWLLDLLTEDAVFFEPDWRELRKASPPGLPHRVTPDGRNLPWLALRLKAESPEQFEAWVEHVRIALPQVTAIEVAEREEDHHAYFRITYDGTHEVTSSGLSDGTLRILALTLLSYLDSSPRLLVVEEPENGIHPRAIEAVLEALSTLYESQVLVSSHSPVVVANVDLGHILAARFERNGSVTVVPGSSHPRLADWKGEIDLGTLFAAGILG